MGRGRNPFIEILWKSRKCVSKGAGWRVVKLNKLKQSWHKILEGSVGNIPELLINLDGKMLAKYDNQVYQEWNIWKLENLESYFWLFVGILIFEN